MRFKALRRSPSLSAEITASLSKAIAEGELKPGERLPSEQILATNFGVARTVVREAIATLKHDGIVQSRKGVGAFIAEPSRRTAFRIGPECFQKRQELLKLMRLRTGVAAEAAAEAASNRSEEQVVRMRSIIADMRAALIDQEQGPERHFEAERQLVQEIGNASGNEHSVAFIGMIDAQIAQNLRSVAVKNAQAAELTAEIVNSHAAIVDALLNKDADAARERTRRHYEEAARRLADRADFADV